MLKRRSQSTDHKPDLNAFLVQGRHAIKALARQYRLDGDVCAVSPSLMMGTDEAAVAGTSWRSAAWRGCGSPAPRSSPEIPTCNIQAPVVAIAERAAELMTRKESV